MGDTQQGKELALIREMCSAADIKLSDGEFHLFLATARRLGLDPLKREIYALKRKTNIPPAFPGGKWTSVERMVIQVGIDGYLAIAERTGEYAGVAAERYGDTCTCALKTAAPHPEWAEVEVRRIIGGAVYTTCARALWHEYASTKPGYHNKETGEESPATASGKWNTAPSVMISKCALALALRRAFPGKFEGAYTAEEMEQADNLALVSPEEKAIHNTTAEIVELGKPRYISAGVEIEEQIPARDATPRFLTPPKANPKLVWKSIGHCPLCAEAGLRTKMGNDPMLMQSYGGETVETQCTGIDPSGKAVKHTMHDVDALTLRATAENTTLPL